ncbi:MAG: alpha/beta hydrolase [Thermogemmatispora sp.]|uniref:alpha/beta fold hydrolase n=1 Tax=Thermogemmatispora sp. TaxID=1968838 RepID=UPI00262493DE|nr:alpha/beta hydrolase [Thermogemmatispora sp.]MBX5458281.1 alpha/beta hydrolase [Thermogemmatispora sp.]
MAAFIPSSTDSTVQLRDGRRVGLVVVGPDDGIPIIHCHGSGSSRLEVTLLAAQAEEAGVRLIGLDRPGIGLSDPKPGYRLLDWPDDVAEVADHLGIERFAVEGFSAGGPYALACAAKIPQRLTACGLISTVAPPELMRKAGTRVMRVIWGVGGRFPGLLLLFAGLVQRMMGTDVASIEKYLARYATRLDKADQQLLSDPQMRQGIARAMAEGFRQGAAGNLAVARVEVHPWGFQPEQVTCGRLFLWHGAEDRIMPIAPVRLLAQRLPYCRATFYADEGHFSTLAHHCQEIFGQLRG